MGILYRTPAPVAPEEVGDSTVPAPSVPEPPEFKGKIPKPSGKPEYGPYGPGYKYICYCIDMLPNLKPGQWPSGIKIIKRCYCGWQKQ